VITKSIHCLSIIPPLYRRNIKLKKEKKAKRVKRVATIEEEKIVR